MNPRAENLALTGIRGVAALWVALFHFCPSAAAHLGWPEIGGAITTGFLGVDLFFILSGFVLGLSYAASFEGAWRPALTRFWVGRAFRILPLHWAMLALLGVLVLLWPSQMAASDRTGANFAASFFLVHAWGVGNSMAWNWPTWSLSTEMAAYVVFPFLVLGASRIRLRRAAAILAACLCLALFVGLLVALDRTSLNVTGRLALVRCILEFAAGYLLSRVSWARVKQGNGELLAAAGLLTIGVAACVTEVQMAAPFGFALIVAACAAPSRLTKAAFANPVSVFLGRISYSGYLVHAVLLIVFEALIRTFAWSEAPFAARVGLGVAYWAALLGLSTLTRLFIEKPGQAAGARIWVKIQASWPKKPQLDGQESVLNAPRLRD